MSTSDEDKPSLPEHLRLMEAVSKRYKYQMGKLKKAQEQA